MNTIDEAQKWRYEAEKELENAVQRIGWLEENDREHVLGRQDQERLYPMFGEACRRIEELMTPTTQFRVEGNWDEYKIVLIDNNGQTTIGCRRSDGGRYFTIWLPRTFSMGTADKEAEKLRNELRNSQWW